ncbi:MAG: hypothetical protein K9I69_05435 [Ignavibacteriales bacterium]|nr:hypothetical protein [Ignavibacteriales bacterium]
MLLLQIIGTIGVFLIVAAYLLLQTKKIESSNIMFSIINGAGSLLIIVSLIMEFNFPAFLIEFFWLGISIYGIIRSIRQNE